MSQNYQRKHQHQNERRKSTTFPVFLDEIGENGEEIRGGSVSFNVQRRLSTISQIYLPHGNEYHPQEFVPPTGLDLPSTFILQQIDDQQQQRDENLSEEISSFPVVRRLSIFYPLKVDRSVGTKKCLNEREKRILFSVEPIFSGFLIFPLLVLFWECGWNVILILLNILNHFDSHLHLEEMSQEEFESYSLSSLLIPYLIGQILLLFLYLGQNEIYQFIQNPRGNVFLRNCLFRLHIFVLASVYIVQWEMLWTIWDQFTPHQWYFELTLSFASLFALIVAIGHLSDLVCSPFIYSIDSFEYCLHFGCPLLTRDMKKWKVNLINFLLYEIFISNLTIITWRGFYHFLDDFLYPNEIWKSSMICLLIGYLLYFPLMYFQTYLEELNLKYEFWTFVSINFPQFYRNIRHLFAFFSCVFAWRGYWILFDQYIYLFEDYYKTYLFLYLSSFLFLCSLGTSSSTNGPLVHIEDPNQFFPLYPHCYISIVYQQFSPLFSSKNNFQDEQNQEDEEENQTKL